MNHEDLEIMLDKELEELILLEAVENKVDDELNNETSLNKEADEKTETKKKKRKKFSSKKLKSILNVRTLLVLLLTLIVNTYAWFIYISTSTLGLDVHVKKWHIDFRMSDSSEIIDIDLDNIYPGMLGLSEEEKNQKTITATNDSEMPVKFTCEILGIIDDFSGEEYVLHKETDDEHIVEKTSEEMLEILNEYPFKIKINLGDKNILEDTEYAELKYPDESVNVSFDVSWLYEQTDESGNVLPEEELKVHDEKDTKFGKIAYDKETEGKNAGIKIKLCIKATQVNEVEE